MPAILKAASVPKMSAISSRTPVTPKKPKRFTPASATRNDALWNEIVILDGMKRSTLNVCKI